MEQFQGLIAAAYTPLTQQGELNLELIRSYAQLLVDNNVKGVFVNGSTGHFTSLTTPERKLILEEWCKCKPDDFKIIVQVGHTSLKESIDLASHASELPVAAIATVAPYYVKPNQIEELVTFCQKTAGAAADIPFYFYHIPQLTGVNLPMIEFLEESSRRIPNLRGIKYSKQDLMEYSLCSTFKDGMYDMLWGMDELMICGLCLGAKGMVGTTYNHIPGLYYEMMNSFDKKLISEAKDLQLKSMLFINTLFSYGFAGAGKSIMKLLGLDFGPVRLPHQNLSSPDYSKLIQELRNQGLLEYFPEESYIT